MKKIIPILLLAACTIVGCKQNEPEKHVYLSRYEIFSLPYDGKMYYTITFRDDDESVSIAGKYNDIYEIGKADLPKSFKTNILIDGSLYVQFSTAGFNEDGSYEHWIECLNTTINKEVFDREEKAVIRIANSPEPDTDIPYTIINFYFDYRYE